MPAPTRIESCWSQGSNNSPSWSNRREPMLSIGCDASLSLATKVQLALLVIPKNRACRRAHLGGAWAFRSLRTASARSDLVSRR